VPDVVLSLFGAKQPLNLALVKAALDRDKEAGRIHAPRLLQRTKAPTFEGRLTQSGLFPAFIPPRRTVPLYSTIPPLFL
jgi:hypothetical protein